MIPLTRENVRQFLVHNRAIEANTQVEIRTRVSSPSCLIMSVSAARGVFGSRFEIKQVRPLNRGGCPWPESLDRILNEMAFLEFCRTHACCNDRVKVPVLLFTDRPNYLYGSTGLDWVWRSWSWRTELRRGNTNDRLAAECGRFLGRLHGASWDDGRRVADLVDRRCLSVQFVEPCVKIARSAGPLGQGIEDSLDEMWNTRRCIVHGSFTDGTLPHWGTTLLASELAHYGDPALDAASFLASLALGMLAVTADKRAGILHMIHSFATAYTDILQPMVGEETFALLRVRAMRLFAVCLLAALANDMSLSAHDETVARTVAREMLLHPPTEWNEFEYALSRHIPVSVAVPAPWFREERLDFS